MPSPKPKSIKPTPKPSVKPTPKPYGKGVTSANSKPTPKVTVNAKSTSSPKPKMSAEAARIYKAKKDVDAKVKTVFGNVDSDDSRFYRRQELRKANVPRDRWYN
jgi:hypothetical protein